MTTPESRLSTGRKLLSILVLLLPIACAHDQSGVSAVHINQVGFLPGSVKQAVIGSGSGDKAQLIDPLTGTAVYEAPLSPPQRWYASRTDVRVADFSSFRVPGQYRLQVEGGEAVPVTIDANVFSELADAALKAFYYNRSGTALEDKYAGVWHRAAGHPDTHVLIHSSAVSANRAAGTSISVAYGWYDAGDYNKYVVNSGISTYTLLAAYEHFPEFYRRQRLNIPESANRLPDILDEAHWNLRWMLAMQDPGDGGVYHKLTTLNFAPAVMPSEAGAERYVVQKTTAAALNFAAVLAVASRVYAEYDAELTGFATRCRDAAVNAYAWARRHPTVIYEQPADVLTGEYGDSDLADEFFWAAAELYLGGAQDIDLEALIDSHEQITTPSWNSVGALGYVSLHAHRDGLPPPIRQHVQREFRNYAERQVAVRHNSPYGVAYGANAEDFHWGGNGTALNQSMLLIRAYQDSGRQSYLNAAVANLDYVLGRNPTGYSFVTGFGRKTPQRIHHRVSESDGIDAPVPGFLVGGANTNGQDGCLYPSPFLALSYLDDWCSYTTNEIAINWNAPLVYVTGALQAIAGGQADTETDRP